MSGHIHLPVEQCQGACLLWTRGAGGRLGEGGGGGEVRVGGALWLPWCLGRRGCDRDGGDGWGEGYGG